MKGLIALANKKWLRVTGALVGLAIPALWVWTLIAPSEEVTRIRSSLIFEIGEPADFEWSPDNIPATFLSDKGLASPAFLKAADEVLAGVPATNRELAVALKISEHLMTTGERPAGPIREDLQTTYSEIKDAGRGYCADFTKVFNGLAIAAGVPVRQWGFSFDAFGSGHTFNEIYDRSKKKWIMIDSFHSLYFVDPITREPLSVVEMHGRLLALEGVQGDIAIERIVPSRFPFRSDAMALDYYRRGMPQLFLVWGNNVFDYENAFAYKTTAKVSRTIEELLSIVTGRYPRMHVFPIGMSERDVIELRLHRTRLILASSALVLAVVFFVFQLLRIRRS